MDTSTLDSLRGVWNEIDLSGSELKAPAFKELARRWQERNRRMVTRFIVELAGYVVIYTGAIVVIAISPTAEGKMFGIKIVVLSLIFFAPVGISLYQSLSSLRLADITRPMTDYVGDSIRKLKRSMRLYVRYSYLFTLFMTATLLTDSFFDERSLFVKVWTFAFIGVVAILIKPVLNLTYGRDVRHFENILKEMEK